ncbi:uncharacterized protein PAE49_018925 [Odontesthes bonariensis]
MSNSDQNMSTHTKGHNPQRQQSTAGQVRAKVYTDTQCGVVPYRKADAVDQPFPNKPVSHRRLPKTQAPLDLHGFEKITLSTRERGHLLPQEHHSNGIRKTTGSSHSREDFRSLPKGELQMARAINEKELMLQEKLWKVGEKIKQTIQSATADIAADDEHKGEDEWQHRGQAERKKTQAKARMSEHQMKEQGRKRDMLVEESWHDDFKQPMNKQNQSTGDVMRSRHQVPRARWELEESPHSKGRGEKSVHAISEHNMKELPKKNKLHSVNQCFRRKGGDEKEHGIWEDNERKHSEQNEAFPGDASWTTEKKYRVKTHKKTSSSDDQQDMPEKSLRKPARSLAAEKQRGARGKLPGESTLPLVPASSHWGPQQQVEPALTEDRSQLLPCKVCNRKFRSDRLETHIQICKKVKQSQRQVFNSYVHRTKGSQIEEFFKTHTRSKTPEASKRKNKRQNYK